MTEDIADRNTDLQRFENAKIKLGLTVKENKKDRNVIWITGGFDNLKNIFGGIFDNLDSHKHPDFEIERDWNEIFEGKELRPAGTYRITIEKKSGGQQLEMLVMNVNARDYQPIVDDMHRAVRQSIMTAAEVMGSKGP